MSTQDEASEFSEAQRLNRERVARVKRWRAHFDKNLPLVAKRRLDFYKKVVRRKSRDFTIKEKVLMLVKELGAKVYGHTLLGFRQAYAKRFKQELDPSLQQRILKAEGITLPQAKRGPKN